MAIRLTKLEPASTALPAASENLGFDNPGFGDMNYLIEPRHARGSRWLRYGMIAAIALIWISIASMAGFWWMNQTRSSSEPLDPQYQRMYITVVARRYWQTFDLTRAQRDLVAWREDELAQLLSAMQNETKDSETRKQLAVLAAALRLPQPQTPPFYSFINRETIFIALILALAPLFLAVGIMMVPYVRLWTRKPTVEALAFEEEDDEKLEELLSDIPVEEQLMPAQEEKTEKDQKPEEDTQKDEEEEKSGELGDLASLFEEEDVSLSALENFAKGMAEISIDDLLKSCRDSIRQLLSFNGTTKSSPLH